MTRYQTEIHIPPDRCVRLQLPANLALGRAIVTVHVQEPEAEPAAFDDDPDRQDVEWWDEFEGEEDLSADDADEHR